MTVGIDGLEQLVIKSFDFDCLGINLVGLDLELLKDVILIPIQVSVLLNLLLKLVETINNILQLVYLFLLLLFEVVILGLKLKELLLEFCYLLVRPDSFLLLGS